MFAQKGGGRHPTPPSPSLTSISQCHKQTKSLHFASAGLQFARSAPALCRVAPFGLFQINLNLPIRCHSRSHRQIFSVAPPGGGKMRACHPQSRHDLPSQNVILLQMLTKWSVADIRIGWEENAATKGEDSEAEHIMIITNNSVQKDESRILIQIIGSRGIKCSPGGQKGTTLSCCEPS